MLSKSLILGLLVLAGSAAASPVPTSHQVTPVEQRHAKPLDVEESWDYMLADLTFGANDPERREATQLDDMWVDVGSKSKRQNNDAQLDDSYVDIGKKRAEIPAEPIKLVHVSGIGDGTLIYDDSLLDENSSAYPPNTAT